MQINITKSGILKSGVVTAIVVAIFFCGYFIGYDRGIEYMENPKGDGEHFYSELQEVRGVNDHIFPFKNYEILYHSTTQCPKINNGVDMDEYVYTYGKGDADLAYHFCPTCMDDRLIKECQNNIHIAKSQYK